MDKAQEIKKELLGKLCIRIDKNGNRISDPLLILAVAVNPWNGGYYVTVDLRSPDGKPPKTSGISRSRVIVEGLDASYQTLVQKGA